MIEASQLEQLSDCSGEVADEEPAALGKEAYFDSEHYVAAYKIGRESLVKGESKPKKIVFR